MREILFRGRPIDGSYWVEGTLFILKRYSTDIDHYYILPANTVCLFCDIPYIAEEVDPSTICQFTGLTDTYRNKIYEGDIVSGCDFDEVDGYGVVEWNDGAFEINNTNVSSTFHDNHWGYELEVIGNIHDNPEMLEGEG